MQSISYEASESYPIAVLTKPTAFDRGGIYSHYVKPLLEDHRRSVSLGDVIAFPIPYNEVNKAPVKFIKEQLEVLLPLLKENKVEHVLVTDTYYFKVLAGVNKAEPHHGYVMPCKMKGFEDLKVILSVNYQALFYNPEIQSKLTMSTSTLCDSINRQYVPPGSLVVRNASYPKTIEEIKKALLGLLKEPEISADIEAFSLKFNKAGIGTIAFSTDKHSGVAFPVDYLEYAVRPDEGYYGYQQKNEDVRALLRDFFKFYQGRITWHNAGYDVKILIYELWMKNLLDMEGMLAGLNVMCKNMDDTKIIAYLATNSCVGNVLGLKALAHEFAGNWAKDDIKDIRLIPLDELLRYNLVDAMSTNYVKEKYYPIMVADQQLNIYQQLMLPSQKMIIQTELCGMPLDPVRVREVKAELQAIEQTQLDIIKNSPYIQMYDLIVQQNAMIAANAKLKVKQHPLSAFSDVHFNPNSGPQLQKLLYEKMGLPVIDYTDTKQPATGADTLKKLINHTTVPEFIDILKALIEYGGVSKILNTFIPAFEEALDKGDGIVWLHGSFNLNGTVSGRLSSSEPNLQNLPATSAYGKLIKSCFKAPPGWLFGGADFNSLEDYISALTSKDPNKLKVYTEGFDGHCLRAKSYYSEHMPDIGDSVQDINSIKKKYPHYRQESKIPTFALTYQGTWRTLVANLGMHPDLAKKIEANYHHLYKVSDEYIEKRLQQASKDGYVTVAFGLRVRTPLLHQVVFGAGAMPSAAAAEGRTAGNAMGQSYCMLNNRAAVAFMKEVWDSPYRLDIKPVALIHDAIYIVWRNNTEITEWVNKHLIKAMSWQELPEIAHDTVKIGAALDIFWPTWANGITLPNDADQQTIIETCEKGMKQYYMEKALKEAEAQKPK